MKSSSPTVKSTADQLQMFSPETWPGSRNVIFSQASPAGVSPSISPGGPTIEKSGQAPALASPSVAPAKAKEPPTNGTCGQSSTGSSASAALQSALENRLRARLGVTGSPEYALTWKHWPMKSGPPICALRASRPRTSDKDCSGWRTPSATDSDRGAHPHPDKQSGEHSLTTESQKAGWPTPRAEDSEQTGAHRGVPDTLNSASKLSGWPTPNWHDGRRPGADLSSTQGGNLNRDSHLAGWATPRSTDAKCGHTYTENMDGKDLAKDASLTIAGWATPCATEVRQGYQDRSRGKKGSQESLTTQAVNFLAGETPGTPAPTAKRGESRPSLNPFFSSWLMGYPKQWTLSALRALDSLSRSKSRTEQRS